MSPANVLRISSVALLTTIAGISLTFAIHVLGRRFLRPKEAETVLFQG